MKRITVLLLNYRRPVNLQVILESLRAQSVPCDIFLWDNAPNTIDTSLADWVVDSSVNALCWPRWFMACYAKTEYVMSLDDDLYLSKDDALEVMLDYLDEYGSDGGIVGIEGVILHPGNPYHPLYPGPICRSRAEGVEQGSVHIMRPDYDTRVDIVKGRLLAARTDAIRGMSLLPPHADMCDDIAISGVLGRGRYRPHIVTATLNDRWEDLPGGIGPMALSTRSDWKGIRNSAKEKYFGV